MTRPRVVPHGLTDAPGPFQNPKLAQGRPAPRCQGPAVMLWPAGCVRTDSTPSQPWVPPLTNGGPSTPQFCVRLPRTPAAPREPTAPGFWLAACLDGGVLPRRLLPGQSHSATRRVRDAFLLRSSQADNEIVLYALGVALEHHDVDLHALVAEPNHVHTNLTDSGDTAALPDFFRDFHALTARALNAHCGRGENFWRQGSYDKRRAPRQAYYRGL